MNHRSAVGGMWEAIGRLQFDYLVRQGLEPDDVLFDVGCGCLRGGRFFVRYLEPGKYFGLDRNPRLLEAGADELGEGVLQEKRPTLEESSSFEFDLFGEDVRADYALAQSLFTHLELPEIRLCLERLRPRMAPEGTFFATFFEKPHPIPPTRTALDFAYSLDELVGVALETGWSVEYIGEWEHPRRQRMLAFHPAE